MKPKPVTLKMLSAPSFQLDDTDFKILAGLSQKEALQLDAEMMTMAEKLTVPASAPSFNVFKALTLEGFDAMRANIRLRCLYAAEDAVMEQLAKDLNGPDQNKPKTPIN